jgi:uncharacterized protein
LNTWHGALADKIFANLFGYRQAQIGDGVDLDYTTWSRGGQMMLGRLQMNADWAAPDTRAHWRLHFAVDPQTGTDAAVDRVLELGGRVGIDPYDSQWGRIARSADPCGPLCAHRSHRADRGGRPSARFGPRGRSLRRLIPHGVDHPTRTDAPR